MVRKSFTLLILLLAFSKGKFGIRISFDNWFYFRQDSSGRRPFVTADKIKIYDSIFKKGFHVSSQ